MMKVPYTNETEKYLHLGSVTIPPFGCRDVEESDIPGYTPPEAAVEAPTNPLAELQVLSIAKIKDKFSTLSESDLNALGDLEKGSQNPRSGLLSAIAEEILNRAAGKVTAETVAKYTMDELFAALSEELAKGEAADADLLALLKAEHEKRKLDAIKALSDEELKLQLEGEKAKGADADDALVAALETEAEARVK
jgi:hypothetical protein